MQRITKESQMIETIILGLKNRRVCQPFIASRPALYFTEFLIPKPKKSGKTKVRRLKFINPSEAMKNGLSVAA